MGLQTDRVRIGLIGAGNLGRTRAKCIAGIPEAELVAVRHARRKKHIGWLKNMASAPFLTTIVSSWPQRWTR